MLMWYVYALYSPGSDIIYVGMSERPEERLEEHNRGKVKSTKGHIPWRKFFVVEAGDREAARRIEKYYKGASGKRKLRKILQAED